MDYQNDFETWKKRFEALSLQQTKLPNQPIDELTAKAETLAKVALKDKEALVQAGLDSTIIDEVPSLSGALRYCLTASGLSLKLLCRSRIKNLSPMMGYSSPK